MKTRTVKLPHGLLAWLENESKRANRPKSAVAREILQQPAKSAALRAGHGGRSVWLRAKWGAGPGAQQEAPERLRPMTAWLLDIGPLVAFLDRSEEYHGWAGNEATSP